MSVDPQVELLRMKARESGYKRFAEESCPIGKGSDGGNGAD